MSELPTLSDLPIYNTLMANRSSALLSVAVDLKLFDLILNKQSITPTELAKVFSFSERGADALLVGLQTLGLLSSSNNTLDWYQTNFTLTEMSKLYLLTTSEYYLGHLIAMDSKSFLTPEKLLEALKKDKPGVYGDSDPWEHQDADGHEQDAEMVII
jgi:hypothetical protein